MDKWIEVENTYLTNQPVIYQRGKRIPDPSVEPTEAWLFIYKCSRTGRGIRRTRGIETLWGGSRETLEAAIDDFLTRDDVVPIENQCSLDYVRFRGEPKRLETVE